MFRKFVALLVLTGIAASCTNSSSTPATPGNNSVTNPGPFQNDRSLDYEPEETIWDLFTNAEDPNTQINVNRFIWNAALDVLSFLPIESIDPFSGVIATDWGRVQGSGTAYRATVYVSSAALDARSLNVAVFRQSGSRSVPVSDEIAEQIEDSILTRARQIYIEQRGR